MFRRTRNDCVFRTSLVARFLLAYQAFHTRAVACDKENTGAATVDSVNHLPIAIAK